VLIDSTVAASHALCEEVVALWASGISVREMAATIGWKTNSLNAAIVKWRRQGWDLPYRNQRSNAGRLRQRQAGREAARHLHPEVMPDVI
jgi:transposase